MIDRLLSHQATILPVGNVENSITFYTSKLGFICTFKWEEPTTYAVLKRDGITINMTLEEGMPNKDHASIYIFCHDVQSVYEEFRNKGVVFEEKLRTTDYGMNEFVILDADKNKLVFGQGIDDT